MNNEQKPFSSEGAVLAGHNYAIASGKTAAFSKEGAEQSSKPWGVTGEPHPGLSP